MNSNARQGHRSQSPASPLGSMGHEGLAGRLNPPTWRVIANVPADQLEDKIRRRDLYDLVHVTQWENTYTLFFRLKAREPRHVPNGEHESDVER